MTEIPAPADYVAVEVAGKAAGIPSRTLRHWISTGKLAAIVGKRGKLVSMGEVERLAVVVGKHPGNAEPLPSDPATFAEEVAGNVAEAIADTALVSDAARQQLAAIREEWLAPLVAQLTEQATTIGRLEAERDNQAATIAELRRRAEAAEAERDALRAQAAPPPRSAEEAPTPGADTPEASAGLWGRLARWWGAGGGSG